MTRWVLLASPFTGGAVWEPVVPELRALTGDDVVVVPLEGADADHVAANAAATLDGAADDVVLVPHSNAGLYVAGLVAALPHRVRGTVFVDALLPGRGARTPTAPVPFAQALEARADEEGLLAPWTGWWPAADLDALFADAAARRRFEREQPRVPAAYLRETVATPAGWAELPVGYLGFGDAYAAEQGEARSRGWPVVVRDGGHLHPLREPGAVARDVAALLDS